MHLDIYDILLTPFYIIVIFFIAVKIKSLSVKTSDDYKYLVPGLSATIFGSVAFTLFYEFYYGGGDTSNYFITGKSLQELIFFKPSFFFEIYIDVPNYNRNVYYYDPSVTFPIYWARDSYAFFVSKIISIIQLATFRTYLPTAILTGVLFFIGKWKLFRILTAEWPHLRKQMAISLFFVPSIIFWTSGLLKDTITLSSVCWYIYGFYYFFIKRKSNWYFITSMLLASYFLVSIKPYVLFALMPGSLIWLSINILDKYNASTAKTTLTIILIGFGSILGYLFLNVLGDKLGLYAVDSVIERASIVQKDLKQDYYGGKSFDIGTYEQSLGGILSVAHKAIFAGLFRPSLPDVRNFVMFISAIENTILMLFFLSLLLKFKVYKIFKAFNYSSLLTFMFLFSIFFSFSVGLSISNFGSLVRLKSPAIPFFVASLFIIHDYYKQLKANYLI